MIKTLINILLMFPRWLWKKCFPKEEGTPCCVLGREASTIDIVPGLITTNIEKAIEIEYKWLDNTMHTFVVDERNEIGRCRGHALYAHNVGCLYGEEGNEKHTERTDEKTEEKDPLFAVVPRESPIGSEYLHRIIKSDIGIKCITGLEELLEEGKSPWRRIIIIGAIVIGLIYLWQSGFITNLLSDVMPGAAPVTPPAPVPQPPVIIPPGG